MSSTGQIASCLPANETSDVNIIKACKKGGFQVFEMRHHREDRSFYVFKRVGEETKGLSKLTLGTGAVPDVRAAETYLLNGTQLILTLFLNPEMAAVCRDHGRLWTPGFTDRLDLKNATGLRARFVKILRAAQQSDFNFFKEVIHRFPDVQVAP